jgi:hypothetical protein
MGFVVLASGLLSFIEKKSGLLPYGLVILIFYQFGNLSCFSNSIVIYH